MKVIEANGWRAYSNKSISSATDGGLSTLLLCSEISNILSAAVAESLECGLRVQEIEKSGFQFPVESKQRLRKLILVAS